eukprot:TRINITY_DN87161_c0_g1_i1.p1 TRINITY_DN87161_c0_g1~~TRINITY_DN87161_c0_g1_i1.p1  ORF type:complete len:295 (-),score=40.17 TRINITY_DN87161_c0_g1_i1:140-982(-)
MDFFAPLPRTVSELLGSGTPSPVPSPPPLPAIETLLHVDRLCSPSPPPMLNKAVDWAKIAATLNINLVDFPYEAAPQSPLQLPDISLSKAGATDVQRYKTKICRNWSAFGSCPYEHVCMFAHGEGELRDGIPADQTEPKDESQNQTVNPSNFRTRFCRNWLVAGDCPYGESCRFAHGAAELREATTAYTEPYFQDPFPQQFVGFGSFTPAFAPFISLPPSPPVGMEQQVTLPQMDGTKPPLDPSKYKTKMCRNWKRYGSCPYENVCAFAHGEQELRVEPA